jgi:hypothetical protein
MLIRPHPALFIYIGVSFTPLPEKSGLALKERESEFLIIRIVIG